MFVNKISTQNYIFIEPLYDAEGVHSLFAQYFDRQIYYTFYGKLTSSGAEAWVNLLLMNFVRSLTDRNFLKVFLRDAGNVGAGIIQGCGDGTSNLGSNVRSIWF